MLEKREKWQRSCQSFLVQSPVSQWRAICCMTMPPSRKLPVSNRFQQVCWDYNNVAFHYDAFETTSSAAVLKVTFCQASLSHIQISELHASSHCSAHRKKKSER